MVGASANQVHRRDFVGHTGLSFTSNNTNLHLILSLLSRKVCFGSISTIKVVQIITFIIILSFFFSFGVYTTEEEEQKHVLKMYFFILYSNHWNQKLTCVQVFFAVEEPELICLYELRDSSHPTCRVLVGYQGEQSL